MSHTRKRANREPEDVKIYNIKNVAGTLDSMNKGPVPSDVLGSYTGMSADETEPEQDADDL